MSFLFIGIFLLFSSIVNSQSDPSYAGPWRSSLDADGSCWTETPVNSCNRAMTIVHGGDWSIQYPYDSQPAFERGYQNQADAVKGDFRVNGEKTGMVMHSSPIEWFESPGCRGKKVEEMTTAECEACKMEVTSYHFISVPDLLGWSNGKVNVMLCVKEESDIPRAISTLTENNATHRAFLELGLGPFLTTVSAQTPDWNSVFYILEIRSPSDVATLAQQPAEVLRRAILVEFCDYAKWGSTLSDDINTLHKLGLRAVGVTDSNSLTATKEQHLEIFRAGFDVVYTYNLEHAVEARVEVNTGRGLPQP